VAAQAPFAPPFNAHCTVPLPVPPLVWMVSVSGLSAKLAVIVLFDVMLTVHWLLLVVSQPVQLLKPELLAAVAVMTTLSPKLVLAGQAPFAPAFTAHCTVPVPVPPLVLTVSVSVCSAKLAVTVLLAVMLTVHLLVLVLSQPLQLVKLLPVLPVAVTTTLSPWL
jgi:hypothetical protein